MDIIQYWQLAVAVVAGILLLILAIALMRAWGGRVRGRQGSRLAVVEFQEIDKFRRLVLIRRDATEHLLLIGGPQDVLVEGGIRPHEPDLGRRDFGSLAGLAPKRQTAAEPPSREPAFAATAPAERSPMSGAWPNLTVDNDPGTAREPAFLSPTARRPRSVSTTVVPSGSHSASSSPDAGLMAAEAPDMPSPPAEPGLADTQQHAAGIDATDATPAQPNEERATPTQPRKAPPPPPPINELELPPDHPVGETQEPTQPSRFQR